MVDPTLCFDVWMIRKLENDDFGQAHRYFLGSMAHSIIEPFPDRQNAIVNDSWDLYQTDRGECLVLCSGCVYSTLIFQG